MSAKLLSILAQYIWIKKLGILNGVALIISIYAHEYGHYFSAKELKYNPKIPKFIPFLGAYVEHEEIKNKKNLFSIAFAGPFWGGLLGIISFYIFLITNSAFCKQVAFFSLILNLLNLIPASILDGGKIADSLSYNKMKKITNVLIVILGLIMKNYFFVFIGAIGIIINLSIHYNPEKALSEMNLKTLKENRNIYLFWIVILTIHSFLIIKNH